MASARHRKNIAPEHVLPVLGFDAVRFYPLGDRKDFFSIGLITQVRFRTAGTAGRLTGWKAQWRRCCAVNGSAPLAQASTATRPIPAILMSDILSHFWMAGPAQPRYV